MPKLSVSEAVETFDVSQPTLYRDMKKGKVSAEKNAKGKRVIDTAELSRVYAKRNRQNGSGEASSNGEAHENVNGNSHFSSERESEGENDKDKIIALLEAQLAQTQAEKSKLLDMLATEQEKTKMLMLPSLEKKAFDWFGLFRKKGIES